MVRVILLVLLLFSVSDLRKGDHVPYVHLKALPERQLKCLVDNAFYEANTEGRLGRMLVTQVVFNRTFSGEDYCKTIYKYKQFSWTLQKKLPGIPHKLRKELEREVLELYWGLEKVPKKFEDITHYHTRAVNPKWNRAFKVVGVFNQHVFY